MDLLKISCRVAATRADKEGVKLRTYEEFRKQWEGKDVYLRFESKDFHSSDKWTPASLNRDFTYGDIMGVWCFSLRYAWPEKPAYLVEMGSAYILRSKSSRILDTGSYGEDELQRDLKKLSSAYGNIDARYIEFHKKQSEAAEEHGVENTYPIPGDGSPFYRLYHSLSYVLGGTKDMNSALRKAGYDLVVDSDGVISEGVYSPAVSSVFLNPAIIDVIDVGGPKSGKA